MIKELRNFDRTTARRGRSANGGVECWSMVPCELKCLWLFQMFGTPCLNVQYPIKLKSKLE
jgi:hypothetical protein